VTARPNRFLGALAILVLAAGASGCVSVFPKSKPAQLYTFGHPAPPAQEATPATPVTAAAERTGVLLAAVSFPRAAQGDTLLTMTGAQAAYIEQSRWVAPAVVLFREAVERRFDDDARRTRLVARGDLARSSLILRLDVREFEAVYAYPEAIPTVAVSMRARLAAADGSPLQERSFAVRRPVNENRVSVIVDGLDEATDEVLGELVTWADAVAAAPRPSNTAAVPAPAVRSTSTSVSTSTTTTVRPAP
jgi:cholesterol transport system auxiliary component